MSGGPPSVVSDPSERIGAAEIVPTVRGFGRTVEAFFDDHC